MRPSPKKRERGEKVREVNNKFSLALVVYWCFDVTLEKEKKHTQKKKSSVQSSDWQESEASSTCWRQKKIRSVDFFSREKNIEIKMGTPSLSDNHSSVNESTDQYWYSSHTIFFFLRKTKWQAGHLFSRAIWSKRNDGSKVCHYYTSNSTPSFYCTLIPINMNGIGQLIGPVLNERFTSL